MDSIGFDSAYWLAIFWIRSLSRNGDFRNFRRAVAL